MLRSLLKIQLVVKLTIIVQIKGLYLNYFNHKITDNFQYLRFLIFLSPPILYSFLSFIKSLPTP